jgi:hypothetical protein
MSGFIPILAAVSGLLLLFLACRSMLPMLALRLRLGTLLAGDTTTLAPVAANKLALIMSPFTPDENLHIGSLTLGSGGGLDPIAGAAGPQDVGVDPVTFQQVIELVEPAGGFRWITSGGAGYPKSVYGFALIDSAAATLLGVQGLVTPIALTADGQFITAEPTNLTFVLRPIS